MSGIYVKTYAEPAINRREALRYAGCALPTEEVSALLEECIAEAKEQLSYKVCYGIFPKNGEITSKALEKNLSGCSKVILFAATVGLPFDRLIMKYGKLSPAKGLIMQAFGAERIEALCDEFCEDIAKELGAQLKPRFSPGYGDLPLSFQREIFKVLDCPRKIGLSLNESLLMSPSKSVTAIVGIKDEDQRIY